MALKEGDLQNTILKNISIDEFEPKTGEAADVMVVGFYLNETAPAKDLYHFINNSILEIRDVEVSPNPNTDNYYMVFIEIDRNKDSLSNIKELVKEVERLSGKLDWHVSTTLSEDKLNLDGADLVKFIQLNPDNYLTKDEFMAQQQEAEQNIEQPLEESLAGISKMSRMDGLKQLARFGKVGEMVSLYDLTLPIPQIAQYYIAGVKGNDVLVTRSMDMKSNLISANRDPRAVTYNVSTDDYKFQAPHPQLNGRTSGSLDPAILDKQIEVYKGMISKTQNPEMALLVKSDLRALEWQKISNDPRSGYYPDKLESVQNSDAILEFLKPSNILEADINDNVLHIKGSRDTASLEIVNFGHGPDIMKEVGISESAIKTNNYDKISFAKLNAMLGEMKALPIDEYIVVHNPEHNNILILKAS